MPILPVNLVQLDLQTQPGGAETYAAFCCRAFAELGIRTRLLIHPHARFWSDMNLGADTECVPVASPAEELLKPRVTPSWFLIHSPIPLHLRQTRPGHLTSAFAHMPVLGRDPENAFGGYGLIFPVSEWVRQGLLQYGLPTWREPLYGVADLSAAKVGSRIVQRSRYAWDRRKGRDRLLEMVEPLHERLRTRISFERRPGLTLGIVSRLTPIKQFPLMFSILAPILARYPQVHLEIFGSGGYASVRDLDQALAPCAGQVRFWGLQNDVASVYRQLDFLLTGLPEKEALGLNIIEAQACGTPVLAVDAPPFIETILEGRTGHFFRDPRNDRGSDFERLLQQLLASDQKLRPDLETEHLARFSFAAFVERLKPIVAEVETRLR
jgi:glycosyltransferase involved in cell wall biosynthesis